MTSKPIYILCNSYENFINNILPFQGTSNFECEELYFHHKKYLLLNIETPHNINTKDTLPSHSKSSFKLFSHSLNQTICYSFEIEKLNQMQYPYKYMASTILSLPYTFTKVARHHDIYGNELLILHN